ncbi:hypothetical protein [Novosphingobium sp. NBM11]|uniref:hypothetical protein n=1 Tax=Novosphingobium sp. NBM11 TaxID=2596914 RepID=UPI0018920654|nr:hypothetical protein [Novosphingobium sp. NBM11]
MHNPYTSCAKQILRGKRHVADCCDERTAAAVVVLLNRGMPTCDTPIEDVIKVKEVLWS